MNYSLAAVERRSCQFIAARLNELRIPCAYQRDDRLVSRGKRKQRVSGLWRPARVRTMLINTTYLQGPASVWKALQEGPGTHLAHRASFVDEKTWDGPRRTSRRILYSAFEACAINTSCGG